jgi:CBS domain-containing protein
MRLESSLHHHDVKLPIRVRQILGAEGAASTARTVFCPVQRRTLTVEECRGCDHCQAVSLGSARDRGFVTCRAPRLPGATESWAKLAKRILPSAADRTPIGAAMTSDVTCVTAELSVESVTELFLQRNFGSAPVVDDEGFPIGVITKSDLLAERFDRGDNEEELPARDRRGVELDRSGFHVEELAHATVGELMMPVAFTLRETDPLSRAAALMSIERVHHLPIVSDDGRVVGILSTLDLASWLAREAGY